MKRAIHCSFCGKGEESVSWLVLAGKSPSSAAICNECLEVCSKIQVKSATEPTDQPSSDLPRSTTPKTHYRLSSRSPELGRLICSFCRASPEKARRLIGSPAGLPQTYICGECVAAAVQESKQE